MLFGRVRAVEDFRDSSQAKVLVATHKRIRNILREADVSDAEISPELLTEPAERALADQLVAVREEVLKNCAVGAYGEALGALAALAEPVSAFFDEVLVMAEDQKIRHNRLRLLRGLQDLFLGIADFSRLQD